MGIPDFQSIMLPLLHLMGDRQERSTKEIVNCLTQIFGLDEAEQNEMISSGKQTVIYNRVGWARTYLSKSALVSMTRRSHYQITERGLEVLRENPEKIDMHFLERFEEYREFRDFKRKATIKLDNGNGKGESEEQRTPEEILEDAYQEIRDTLAQDVIAQIKSCSSSFFERLVVDLLVQMGYGGSRKDAARAVGHTKDEGIDGIIDEDRLGLDTIYIQAKRWENPVGRPEIQKFVGALMGKRARKGIFITTSYFSNDALSYVSNIDFKIVLIDGNRLAELMIDHDIGVSEITSYKLKRIDSDYFSDG
jgi:restriction system protein